MCRSIPSIAWCASADSLRRYFGWTFKGPRALRPLTGGDSKPGALVMCDIPLDLERRFERRWAARFSGRLKSIALKGSSSINGSRPTIAKEKPAGVEPAGSRARTKPVPLVGA
jgi:hypothetical protein